MDACKGQLFAPDLPPGGLVATLKLAGTTLQLETGERHLRVASSAITFEIGGFDGRQWRLTWPLAGGGQAILVLPPGQSTEALLDALQAILPSDQAARLDRQLGKQRRTTFRFRLGMGLAGLLLALPFILLLAFWQNADRVAAWAADHVDIAQERQLGELAFAQLRPSLKLQESGPAAELVKTVGNRLTAGSAYSYRWLVADSPEINAFALPGGTVVVYTGLLQAADSAEEVAGVLAHEVQHVELRHSLRNLIHGLGWQALLSLAIGDLSGGIWSGLAEQLGSMRYSRDLERQADLGGLSALRKAGISPQGMPRFFAKLARQDGRGMALLASHPSSEERMQALLQAIAAQGDYPTTALPYDWPAFKAALAHR